MIISEYKDEFKKVDDVALVKIRCAYKAYKNYKKVAQFYSGLDANGKVYAIIAKVGGYITLYETGQNTQELKDFLEFIKCSGIFTSYETAKRLNLKIDEKCLSFKISPPYQKSLESSENGTQRKLMECLNSGLCIEDTDGFIADVTFRTLHSCADYVIKDGGGALVFYSQNEGLLNGIATPKNVRRNGLGSCLLKMLLSKVGEKEVYACCSEHNKEFYIKNGFTLIGESAYCEEK